MRRITVKYRESGERMKTKNYLANAIDTADMKAQHDAEAKKIVADKGVLSWIVKYTVKEGNFLPSDSYNRRNSYAFTGGNCKKFY